MTLQEELNVLRASILGAQRQLEIATLRLEQIEALVEGKVRAINRIGESHEPIAKQSPLIDPELLPMDSPQIRQEREPGSGE